MSLTFSFRQKAKIGGFWNIPARFGFMCRRFQCFVTIFFILGSVLLYLSDKEILVAVSFFFSFKTCYLSCKLALLICSSINDLSYSRFWNWLIIFAVWFKVLAVKSRFVLSVKLDCMVCYLSAISGVLIEHRGNFVCPLVSYILLFGVYYYIAVWSILLWSL